MSHSSQLRQKRCFLFQYSIGPLLGQRGRVARPLEDSAVGPYHQLGYLETDHSQEARILTYTRNRILSLSTLTGQKRGETPGTPIHILTAPVPVF